MKILAFAATNHSNSINRKLVEYAAVRLKDKLPSAQFDFVDLNDFEMPIYSIDREMADGIHPLAEVFRDRIGAADAVLVSFAEHNGNVTAAWKNIFDWMSRIDRNVWQDKPMVMLAASPGPGAGAYVLANQEVQAPFFGANLKGKHGVGGWHDAWDARARKLLRDTDINAIDQALDNFVPQMA